MAECRTVKFKADGKRKARSVKFCKGTKNAKAKGKRRRALARAAIAMCGNESARARYGSLDAACKMAGKRPATRK